MKEKLRKFLINTIAGTIAVAPDVIVSGEVFFYYSNISKSLDSFGDKEELLLLWPILLAPLITLLVIKTPRNYEALRKRLEKSIKHDPSFGEFISGIKSDKREQEKASQRFSKYIAAGDFNEQARKRSLKELDDLLSENPFDPVLHLAKSMNYVESVNVKPYLDELYMMMMGFSNSLKEREVTQFFVNHTLIHEYTTFPKMWNALSKQTGYTYQYPLKRIAILIARGTADSKKNRPITAFRELLPLFEKEASKEMLDFIQGMILENELYSKKNAHLKLKAEEEAKAIYYEWFENFLKQGLFTIYSKPDSTNDVFIGKAPYLPNLLFVGKKSKEPSSIENEFNILNKIYFSELLKDKSILPRPFYFGKVGDEYYLAERFFDGELLRDYLKNPSKSNYASSEALSILYGLMNLITENSSSLGFDSIPEYNYENELERKLEKSSDFSLAKDDIMDAFSIIFKELENIDRSLSHGDPHSGNFIFSKYFGTKVIDFERLAWAHYLFDIAYFLEQPDVSETIDDRVDFAYDSIKSSKSSKKIKKKYIEENYPLFASYVDLLQAARSSVWYEKKSDDSYLGLGNYFKNRASYNLNELKNRVDSKPKKKLEQLISFLDEEKYKKK
ncbi:MAG: Phosphotransferase enzyme family [Candidatus Woesearchaeota archaeon]|nr:Phosphotransferase enzyme family [Candidatus Woesearchaeota archaeon]